MIFMLFLLTYEGVEFLSFLILLTIVLAYTAILLERDRFLRLAVVFRARKRKKEDAGTVILFPYPMTKEKLEEAFAEIPKSSLDAASADELISDKMAKNLIHKAQSIKTFGNKKRIVKIGELSSAFSAGEHVDINRMKAVGIIPYNTFKIKVLASGELDKKLFVYANGFSKTALKMIALKGGEATLVHSERAKMPREDG